MQILNTLQKRHKYNMVHPRWSTSTHKLPVLYYYTIQQNEGIQPATTPLHFLFTLSQSLSCNHKDCFTVLSFYNGITMGKYYGSPNTMGLKIVGQQTSQIFLVGDSPSKPC